jgi:hypothetical protein
MSMASLMDVGHVALEEATSSPSTSGNFLDIAQRFIDKTLRAFELRYA